MVTGNRILALAMTVWLLLPGAGIGKDVKTMTTLTITCGAFSNGESIPARFTCDGQDVNPQLEWKAPPPGTRSLALIMDDPDAPMGTWVHWVLWNIPPDTGRIEEMSVPAGGVQGRNDWKRNAYGGPCPPSGTHHYYFRIFALDTTLDLPVTTTKADLERAMKGHILARGELMGTYKRR